MAIRTRHPEHPYIRDFPYEDMLAIRAALQPKDGLLDPDMPTQELKLHMGEMTAQEERTARAAIRWANTRQPKDGVMVQELEVKD
jgi:hypothetical protein